MSDMFHIEYKYLKQITQETGFIQNSLEKVLRLIDILNILVHHPLLKSCFVLKGGTVLNLFYYNIPRLSVDVDLNYIKSINKNIMLKDRSRMVTILTEIFSEDYKIEETRKEYALSQFELEYKAYSGSNDKLKVEINYLHRLPLNSYANRDCNKFNILLRFPVMSFEEIIASKTIALLCRSTPRDLYDIYQTIISGIEFDKSVFRSLIIFYGLVSDVKIFEILNIDFSQITSYAIRRFLNPLLVRGKYPDRDEMVMKVEKFLKPFLELSNKETTIIESFYSTGNLDIEFLLPQSDLIKNILQSPTLKWRIQNIKKHL